MNELFQEVEILIRNGIPHRRGFRLTDPIVTHEFVVDHLFDEAHELKEQVKLDAKNLTARGVSTSLPSDQMKDELADILGTVVDLAKRFGMTADELEQRSLAKLRKRFLYPKNPNHKAPIFIVARHCTVFWRWMEEQFGEFLHLWDRTRFSAGQFHYVVNREVFRGREPSSIYRVPGWELRPDFPQLVEAIYEEKCCGRLYEWQPIEPGTLGGRFVKKPKASEQ